MVDNKMKAEAEWRRHGSQDEKRPRHRTSLLNFGAEPVDSILHYRECIQTLEAQIAEERVRISNSPSSEVCCDVGFVTFVNR